MASLPPRPLHDVFRSLVPVAVLAFGWSADANAAPPRAVAVAPTAGPAEQPEHWMNRMDAALLAGLHRAMVPTLTVGQTCEGSDADCVRTSAEQTGAELHLSTTIAANGPDWDVNLSLVATQTGEVRATVAKTCELCGDDELAEMLESAAARLGARIMDQADAPRVEIAGEPEGASVWLDGEEVGTTPLNLEVTPGDHTVEIRQDGFNSQVISWNADPGVRERLRFTLVPAATEPEPESKPPLSDRSRRLRRTLGWTGIGLGAALVGTGATFLALDGRPFGSTCTADNRDIDGRCPETWESTVGGAVTLATGVASVGAGIGLVVSARGRNRRERLRARVGFSHRGVWLSGEF